MQRHLLSIVNFKHKLCSMCWSGLSRFDVKLYYVQMYNFVSQIVQCTNVQFCISRLTLKGNYSVLFIDTFSRTKTEIFRPESESRLGDKQFSIESILSNKVYLTLNIFNIRSTNWNFVSGLNEIFFILWLPHPVL